MTMLSAEILCAGCGANPCKGTGTCCPMFPKRIALEDHSAPPDQVKAADALAEAVHMLIEAVSLHRVSRPEDATRTAVMVHGCEAILLKRYDAYLGSKR